MPRQRGRWLAMTWFFDSLTVGVSAHIGPSRSAVVAGAERGDVGIAPYEVSGAVYCSAFSFGSKMFSRIATMAAGTMPEPPKISCTAWGAWARMPLLAPMP